MTSFRNFLITFLVSALLFGVVGYFTTVFVSGVINDLVEQGGNSQTDNRSGGEPGEGDDQSKSEKIPEGESFSFLIILTDYDPVTYKDYVPGRWESGSITSNLNSDNEELGLLLKRSRHVHATGLVLVKADKESREFLLCYLTPETRVYTSSGALNLGDVYGNYGVNVLKEHVKALTGISVDYHFILDAYRMSEVVESFGRYSIDLDSEIYSYGDYYMASANFSAEERKAAFDPAPVPADDGDKKETGTYEEEIVKPPVLDRALFAGTHELDRDTLCVISCLKECSLDDIEFKGGYTLDIIEHYLRRIAGLSKDDLVSKASKLTENTPYASDYPLDMKPALASDFTVADVGTYYEMFGAIEYFKVTSLIYPGNYISTKDASIGYYVPTLRTAVEDLLKFR